MLVQGAGWPLRARDLWKLRRSTPFAKVAMSSDHLRARTVRFVRTTPDEPKIAKSNTLARDLWRVLTLRRGNRNLLTRLDPAAQGSGWGLMLDLAAICAKLGAQSARGDQKWGNT